MNSSVQRILKALGKTKTLQDLQSIDRYVKANYQLIDKRFREKINYNSIPIIKNYMKSERDFYGMKLPDVHRIIAETISKQEDFQKNFLLSEQLIRSNVFQLKIGGIDILTKCYHQINIDVLKVIRQIITEGHIQGWACSDSLAVPIKLSCIKHGFKMDDYLLSWQFQKENTWVRRTAIASFAKRAMHGDQIPNYQGFSSKLYELCRQCVQYDNRFNQLGIGWLLRELSKKDKQGVVEFIESNYEVMSRQGIRYAIQKMDADERKRILGMRNQIKDQNKKERMSRPKRRPTK